MSVLDERTNDFGIGSFHQNSFFFNVDDKSLSRSHDEFAAQQHLLQNYSMAPPQAVSSFQAVSFNPTNINTVISRNSQNYTTYSGSDPANVTNQPTYTTKNVPYTYNSQLSIYDKSGYSAYSSNDCPKAVSQNLLPNFCTAGSLSKNIQSLTNFAQPNATSSIYPPPRTKIEPRLYSAGVTDGDIKVSRSEQSAVCHGSTQSTAKNGYWDPALQATHGVHLLITNLDYNINAKEWRKILLTQFQSVIKSIHSLTIQPQADGTNCAIMRVGSIEEARLAISHFHRKKIGYKRIQINIWNSTSPHNHRNLKTDVISILRSVPGSTLPVCKFIEMFEKRYNRVITMSELYKMRDILDIKEQFGVQGGKYIVLNTRTGRAEPPEKFITADSLVCRRHCPEGSPDYLRTVDNPILPSILISLNLFRQQVTTILRDHNRSLPLISFPLCYKFQFGELPTSTRDTSEFSQIQSEHVSSEVSNQSEKTNITAGIETANLLSQHKAEFVSPVAIEHLLTCVPHVRIHTEPNGIRKIVFEPDQPQDVSGFLPYPSNATDNHYTKTRNADFNPMVITNVSPTSSYTGANPSGVLQDQLHQFSREVVDLLKHQPNCQLLLSKFIPTYHHHFGKQCRVADYGYSKLHELIDALPNVVHVMGSGNNRVITLSHRVQVRRFTNELIKVLKSQSSKSCKMGDYPSLFKKVYRKDFRIGDYGVCYLSDLLSEISDNNIELAQNGHDYIVSLPKRVQTAEERERTQLFAMEVADLLRQAPRCKIAFNKFIPSYHHHFGRQCRVADYGFTKLIDLLEAIPNVIKLTEENGEKVVTLVCSRHLRVVAEHLLAMLEVATNKRIRLSELPTLYMKAHGYTICPEDFQLTSLKELLYKLPKIVQIVTCSSEANPPAPSQQQNSKEDSAKSIEHSVNPDSAKSSSETVANGSSKHENNLANELSETEYICLADRSHIKHLAHKVLLLMFEVSSGILSCAVFRERFHSQYNEDPNLNLIEKELSDIVEFREKRLPCKNSGATGVLNEPLCAENTVSEQSTHENQAPATTNSHPNVDTSPEREIALRPIVVFARELRDLLRQHQGKILLVQLCAAYQRRFGTSLQPQRYNHASLATLIQAVDFVAITRGRGVRCMLILCQDFLGKLSYRVAYPTKPLVESDPTVSESPTNAFNKSSRSTDPSNCTQLNSTITPHNTELPQTVISNQSSVSATLPTSNSEPQNYFKGINTLPTVSIPYSYYQNGFSHTYPIQTYPATSAPRNQEYYSPEYDFGGRNYRAAEGFMDQSPRHVTCPQQSTNFEPFAVVQTNPNFQLPNYMFENGGETSNTYSGSFYPSQSVYSVPMSVNYSTGVPPLAHPCTFSGYPTNVPAQATYACGFKTMNSWPGVSNPVPLASDRFTTVPNSFEEKRNNTMEQSNCETSRFSTSNAGFVPGTKPSNEANSFPASCTNMTAATRDNDPNNTVFDQTSPGGGFANNIMQFYANGFPVTFPTINGQHVATSSLGSSALQPDMKHFGCSTDWSFPNDVVNNSLVLRRNTLDGVTKSPNNPMHLLQANCFQPYSVSFPPFISSIGESACLPVSAPFEANSQVNHFNENRNVQQNSTTNPHEFVTSSPKSMRDQQSNAHQNKTVHSEESTSSFSIDGLLAEFRLEDSQQQSPEQKLQTDCRDDGTSNIHFEQNAQVSTNPLTYF